MRVMVVWCPDWPVVAALADEGLPHPPAGRGLPRQRRGGLQRRGPRATAYAGGCAAATRSRAAPSWCYAANPDRDARAFEPVLAAVEELRPGVAPLRPGAAGAPGARPVLRRRGGRRGAARRAAGRARRLGLPGRGRRRAVHRRAGGPAGRAAGLAGRRAGGVGRRSCAGCRSRSSTTSTPVEPAAAARAAHPRRPRGAAGRPTSATGSARTSPRCTGWSAASARSSLATRTPPPDLVCQVDFEPPLDSAETISFSVRQTAEGSSPAGPARPGLHRGPGRGARATTRAARRRATWLHPRWFTAADLVDRVHWQLQGELRGGDDPGAGRAGCVFAPVTVEPDAAHADGLWGGDRRAGRARHRPGAGDARPRRRGPSRSSRAAAPRPTGRRWCRGASGRPGCGPTGLPWPGSIPPPAPARVFAEPVGGRGRRRRRPPGRRSTTAGAVTCEPDRFRPGPSGEWQPVAAWAGPWPVEEQWWEAVRPAGRALPGGRRRRPRLADALGRRRLVDRSGL